MHIECSFGITVPKEWCNALDDGKSMETRMLYRYLSERIADKVNELGLPPNISAETVQNTLYCYEVIDFHDDYILRFLTGRESRVLRSEMAKQIDRLLWPDRKTTNIIQKERVHET